MADFDDEPVVPRSSKQAKMLGVGVDLDPAGSKGLGARAGRNNGFGDPSGDPGLESWNGWGAKVGNSAVGEGSSSPRLDNGSVRVIAPWGQSASTNEVSIQAIGPNSKQPTDLLIHSKIARARRPLPSPTSVALAPSTLSPETMLLPPRRSARAPLVSASSSARRVVVMCAMVSSQLPSPLLSWLNPLSRRLPLGFAFSRRATRSPLRQCRSTSQAPSSRRHGRHPPSSKPFSLAQRQEQVQDKATNAEPRQLDRSRSRRLLRSHTSQPQRLHRRPRNLPRHEPQLDGRDRQL